MPTNREAAERKIARTLSVSKNKDRDLIIRKMRKGGKSQAQIAKVVGINQRTVSYILRKKFGISSCNNDKRYIIK